VGAGAVLRLGAKRQRRGRAPISAGLGEQLDLVPILDRCGARNMRSMIAALPA